VYETSKIRKKVVTTGVHERPGLRCYRAQARD